MWNAGLDESQAGIKIAGRNYQQPQICRWHHPYGRKWRGTKGPLDEGERGEWKACLKLNIQKTKIMTSGSIISWQIEGEKLEAITNFIFLGSKITVAADCRHEIKWHLLLGSKAMTNLCVCVCMLSHSVMADSMDWTLGSSDHGICQIRIQEWVAISYSRGSSGPSVQTHICCISCIGRWILHHCATWEAPWQTWTVYQKAETALCQQRRA